MTKLTTNKRFLLHKIFEKVMKINNNGNQLWFELSPHVNKVCVSYYTETGFISKDFYYNELDKAIKCLDAISNNNEIINKY